MATNYREMAEIIAKIQELQTQNGLRLKSPLGQGYYPMDNTPAPPGYRLNEAPSPYQMAMKNRFPINQTEGAPRGGFQGSRAMSAVRGGNSGSNMLEGAAKQVRSYQSEGDIGLAKAIEFAARRWEVDPKVLTEFLKTYK